MSRLDPRGKLGTICACLSVPFQASVFFIIQRTV